LYFKRAFVDPTIDHPIKTRPALVEEWRRRKVRVTTINSWAAR